MQALLYRRSVPRYLLGAWLSRWFPHRFFSSVAPLSLTEVPFDPPAGWITLRPRLCGICGSDLRLLRGTESFLMEPYASFPAVLGHEVVAEVLSAPETPDWRQGDRVVVEPLLPCEVRGLPPCRFCAQGLYNLCENFTAGGLPPGMVAGYNQRAGGGMAERMAAHPSRLIRLPDAWPDETAVLTDSLASALQPVLDHFPDAQDRVVVYGGGIVGQHIIRILRALKFEGDVVCVSRYPFQKSLALAGGAGTVLLNPRRNALAQAVGARFLPTTLGGGNLEGGADRVFDCVGNSHSLQDSLLMLRGRGTYVMVGTIGRIAAADLSAVWFRELRITGSSCYSWSRLDGQRIRTYRQAVELLSSGRYPTAGLLTHRFPLSRYHQAFQTAFSKSRYSSMKVVIDLRQS